MPTIRVYPQNGMSPYGGMNSRFGGAVSLRQHYGSQLSSQKKLSSMQIQYERALANERIKGVRLEERARLNPFAMGMGMGMGGFGSPMMAGYANPALMNPYIGASMMGGNSFWNNIGGMMGRWF